MPGIECKEEVIVQGAKQANMCAELLNLAANESLTQVQEEPTRENNVLDLYFTNRRELVKHTQTVLGIADHEIVVVDSVIKATVNKAKPRKVYRFNDANWDMIREDATKLNDKLNEHFGSNSVDENWEHFKTRMAEVVEKHVPAKMTSTG